jgi:predicted TIM-barrel fold metal-dependent hydrolase
VTDDVVDAWYRAARALLPKETQVWDAHTHSGHNDPDGIGASGDHLVAQLDDAGHAGAVVTSNQDPGGYELPNDRVLAEAVRSGGRLIPFLRVDPRQGPAAVAETERSLAAGHRGVKLHPRAERFRLGDSVVEEIAGVAAAAGVPVLVHAGRGVPSLGADAIGLCDRVDGLRLILAHAAISDLSWLGPVVADHPGLYIDTSWWDVTDLLALAAWVPPGRIVYASDTPYGGPYLSFVLTMRVAAAAGYGTAQLGGLFGGTLHRLLAGEDGADLGPAPGGEFVTGDPGLVRVHASLHGAIVTAFAGGDPAEPVSLARLGCIVPESALHAEVYAAVGATLDRLDSADHDRRRLIRTLVVAAAAALTPEVPLPVVPV